MPIVPMKRECCGTVTTKAGPLRLGWPAQPSSQSATSCWPVTSGTSASQPASSCSFLNVPSSCFFLNVVVHCCDVASVWRWQPERHNMVSQSPDWRGENGHYGSSCERSPPGSIVLAQE